MENETIADIVREMRGMLCRHDKDTIDIPPKDDIFYIESLKCEFMQRYADRIEAAAKATIYTDNSETLRNALIENDRLRAAMDLCGEYLTDDKRGVMSFAQWLGWKLEEATNAS